MNQDSTVQVTPNVQIRVQILNTIARSIYSDSRVKIREAVANSMDNEATWFILYADRPSRTISLMDNGIGITKAPYMELEISRPTLDLMARLKRAFDPNNILNPGKMLL